MKELTEAERMDVEMIRIYFTAPFQTTGCGLVLDKDERVSVEIRGWGRLTGLGGTGYGLSDDAAVSLQTVFERVVARALNDHFKRALQ